MRSSFDRPFVQLKRGDTGENSKLIRDQSSDSNLTSHLINNEEQTIENYLINNILKIS